MICSEATDTAISRVRGTGASWKGLALSVLDTYALAWLCHPSPVQPYSYPTPPPGLSVTFYKTGGGLDTLISRPIQHYEFTFRLAKSG